MTSREVVLESAGPFFESNGRFKVILKSKSLPFEEGLKKS